MPSDNKAADYGMAEICGLTGLRPHEVRYLRFNGHLKPSGRDSRGHFRYAEQQVGFLTLYCGLRRSGVGLAEAIAIAKASTFGTTGVRRQRLVELAQQLGAEAVVRLRTSAELSQLWADGLGAP